MVTAVRRTLASCEGFRLESPQGLVGWVEETWLGPADEPVALVIRVIDSREGLLLAEDVDTVIRENELLTMRRGARLLELELPRVQTTPADGLSASWRTTGESLELPEPPGPIVRALLAIRPWRLAPPPRPPAEQPLWVTLVALYTVLAAIVCLLIALDFLIAWLIAGSAI